jgi:hypothetical protein
METTWQYEILTVRLSHVQRYSSEYRDRGSRCGRCVALSVNITIMGQLPSGNSSFFVDTGGERTAVEHFCPCTVRRKIARLFRAANRGSMNLYVMRSAKIETLDKI